MADEREHDNELNALRARIRQLEIQRANASATLLSSPNLETRLQHHLQQGPVTNPAKAKKALEIVQKQKARNQENAYRTGAGITAYKLKDPDPNAIDNGNVLGVKIEVAIKETFLPPYDIHLVRPDARERFKTVLRITHHTVPPAVPLEQLAAKYLPQPQANSSQPPEQDLEKLVRCLRRELVSYHLLKASVEQMRVEAGLPIEGATEKEMETLKVLNAFVDSEDEEDDEDDDDTVVGGQKDGPKKIVDVTSDATFREVRINWSNGHVAKVTLDKEGAVQRAIVKTAEGIRVPGVERKILGRVEGLIGRLADKG